MKLFLLLAITLNLPLAAIVVVKLNQPPAAGKEAVKLRALADMLILTSRGLTSRQEKWEIEMAEEFAPLAEFVNSKLKD